MDRVGVRPCVAGGWYLADHASDAVINKRMEVFGRETRPVLDLYPSEIIHRIDATMSQIRVLSEIVRIMVPLKEALDGPDNADDAVSAAAVPASSAV